MGLRTDAISGVACGDFHTIAVSHAGKIFAWGTGEIRLAASLFGIREAMREEIVRPRPSAAAASQSGVLRAVSFVLEPEP